MNVESFSKNIHQKVSQSVEKLGNQLVLAGWPSQESLDVEPNWYIYIPQGKNELHHMFLNVIPVMKLYVYGFFFVQVKLVDNGTWHEGCKRVSSLIVNKN